MRSYRFSLKQLIPLLPCYVFVGMASGVLYAQAGYSPLMAALSGGLIYSGSMQIVLVTLVSSGASLLVIAASTVFVSLRLMFYGIGFVERFKKIGGWKYPYMVLTLTDETYSVLCNLSCPEDTVPTDVEFFVQLNSHLLWILANLFGALLGGMLPIDMTGIDFSAPAFFMAVAVNQWFSCRSHLPAITGFVAAAGLRVLLGPDNFMLPALTIITMALIALRGRIERAEGRRAA